MTRAAQDALKRLQAAADVAEPAVRARILQALRRLQASIPADRLERALRTRDVLAIHDLATLLPVYLRPALDALRTVLQAGVKAGLVQARNGPVAIRFDAVSPYAVQAARDHAAKLVRQVTDETRAAIRKVVARSYVEGIPPREAAKLIRPLVGLTSRQANAVLRRYAKYVGEGFSRAVAESRAKAYAAKLLRHRALTIARTETIAAATRGQLAAWQQAQAHGRLSPSALKLWIVTPDDRLCPKCRAMGGQTAPLAGQFMGPFGTTQAPPLHPNCRCAIGLTFANTPTRRAA